MTGIVCPSIFEYRVGDLIEPDVFIEQDYDARPFEPFPLGFRRRFGGP